MTSCAVMVARIDQPDRFVLDLDPGEGVTWPMLQEAAELTRVMLAELGLENDPLFKLAKELEKIALEDEYFVSRKLYPNVDFYSGIVQRAIGIPVSLFTAIFARAGEVAHRQCVRTRWHRGTAKKNRQGLWALAEGRCRKGTLKRPGRRQWIMDTGRAFRGRAGCAGTPR